MSGSGNDDNRRNVPNGGGNGLGGNGGGPDGCKSLSVRTTLNSPKAAVIQQLQVGNMLTIGVRTNVGIEVVVARWQGQEAGSITFSQLLQLILCLRNGFSFVGEVVSLQGGSCEVLVRPASVK